jgi:transposase
VAKFSNEFKKSLVEKVLVDSKRSIRSVANEAQVGVSSLHQWVHAAKASYAGLNTSANERSINWSSTKKLQAIINTASLSDGELNHYCRQQEIYKSQLEQWKIEFMSERDQSAKEINNELKMLRSQNKQLQRELHRKEKALAEASALLLLKKNLDQLWSVDEDNSGQ